MDIIIGSKYEQTRAKLREQIRLGTISVLEVQASNHACYFCSKHIPDKMVVLTIKEMVNDRETESEYYTDNLCYRRAKLFMYYKETPISLN